MKIRAPTVLITSEVSAFTFTSEIIINACVCVPSVCNNDHLVLFVFPAEDNFCRVCRTNLRNVIRGRGGLYQQLNRAPSPIRNNTPPRPEPSEQEDDSSSEEDGERGNVDGDGGGAGGNQGPANNIGGGEIGRNRPAAGHGGGGFLRVVAIDDGE